MNAFLLFIVLTTPTGGTSQTAQPFADRAACVAEEAAARKAMREQPHGYKLVSAKCVPQVPRGR